MISQTNLSACFSLVLSFHHDTLGDFTERLHLVDKTVSSGGGAAFEFN